MSRSKENVFALESKKAKKRSDVKIDFSKETLMADKGDRTQSISYHIFITIDVYG